MRITSVLQVPNARLNVVSRLSITWKQKCKQKQSLERTYLSDSALIEHNLKLKFLKPLAEEQQRNVYFDDIPLIWITPVKITVNIFHWKISLIGNILSVGKVLLWKIYYVRYKTLLIQSYGNVWRTIYICVYTFFLHHGLFIKKK